MQPDYVLRIIEQLGAMLAKLTALQRAGAPAQAQWTELDRLCRQHAGLSLGELKALSPAALAEHLEGEGGGLRHSRAVLLAELLAREAQTREAAGDLAAALPGYVHAFCLLADSLEFFSFEEQALLIPKAVALAERLRGPLQAHPYLVTRLRHFDPSPPPDPATPGT